MKSALAGFKGHNKFFLLILLELVFAVLAAVSFLNLFNFNIFEVFSQRKIFFSFSNNFFDIVFFVASLILFVLVFFLVRRNPVLYGAQKDALAGIKESAKQKIRNAKSDPRAPALLLIEFSFVIIVFISLSAFFDPFFELIPWSKASIGPQEAGFLNIIIALIVLYGFYWLYSQTADYRKVKAPQKKHK